MDRHYEEATGVIWVEVIPACLPGFKPWLYNNDAGKWFRAELLTSDGMVLAEKPRFEAQRGSVANFDPKTNLLYAQGAVNYVHEMKGVHVIIRLTPVSGPV
jgi:hypothetical protein